MNRLLDLEEGREAALSLIPLGGAESPPAEPLPEPREIRPLNLETLPLSGRRVDYPATGEIRAKGYNTDADAIALALREDLGLRLGGQRVLLLGAGGAAPGVVALTHELGMGQQGLALLPLRCPLLDLSHPFPDFLFVATLK